MTTDTAFHWREGRGARIFRVLVALVSAWASVQGYNGGSLWLALGFNLLFYQFGATLLILAVKLAAWSVYRLGRTRNLRLP